MTRSVAAERHNLERPKRVPLNVALTQTPSSQEAPQSGIRLLAQFTRKTYTTGVTATALPANTNVVTEAPPSVAADPLRALTQDARLGDPAAVRKLLDAVAPSMLGVIRAVLGRADRDVEDVLQESLVGVVQGLASFRGESTMTHFARSVALRRSLDQRRKRARRGHEVPLSPHDDSSQEALVASTDPSSSGSVAALLQSTTQSPAANVIAQQRREAFRGLLATLRPEQAEAFAQRVLFGYSKEEIARETGVSVETVKSRLRLAKNALRTRIQDDPALLELAELDNDDR